MYCVTKRRCFRANTGDAWIYALPDIRSIGPWQPGRAYGGLVREALREGIVAFHGGLLPRDLRIAKRRCDGVHVGSMPAAVGRAQGWLSQIARELQGSTGYSEIYAFLVQSSKPFLPGGAVLNEDSGAGGDLLDEIFERPESGQAAKLRREGYDTVPYANVVEDRGILSIVLLKPWQYAWKEGVYQRR